MPLTTGTRLGPYEVLVALGAGGMGEVYKARDTRLDRIVAIKVLPEALAGDPQFRERFDREARTISQLDHPNICTLYDVGDQDGVSFLVMQFLEGETLDARLKPRAPSETTAEAAGTRGASDGTRGLSRALPIDEALRIAIEIADALDKAHRAAVVHRDLKPANIFLARTGAAAPPVAKLLDFGLAKTGVPAVSNVSGTMLPTTPVNITALGTILGTFQYMAPEQLEGADADARTDIFAFGAVVYEMVTGRKAFEGKSQVSLIGAILEREPAAITTVVPKSPAALDRIIKRCLAKDPDRRWQTASDLAHELRWVAESAAVPETAGQPVPATVTVSRSKSSMWWKVATAAAGLLAAAAAWAGYVARSTTPQVARFYVNPPEKMSFVSGGRRGASGIISPDGRRLVLNVQEGSQKIGLWLRSIDALTAQPLPGTEDAAFPFWSPDSRAIGFFAHEKLMKIDAAGGPPQTLCPAPTARGGTWSRDGIIVFGGGSGPLNRVSSAGGQPAPVTKLIDGQADHRFPTFLPDGRHFLFFGNSGAASVGSATSATGVFLGSLDSPDARRIVGAETGAVYAAGHLLFVRQSMLMAQPFNVNTFDLSGDPIPVAEQVTRNYGGVIAFSVSDAGALSYGIGPSQSSAATAQQLTWIDRKGTTIEAVGERGTYRGFDLSPDGKRIAVHRHEGGSGGDIWILDGPRIERFTFDPAAENESPIWSPDGQWIAFAARRGQKQGLYRKLANLAASEELLIELDAAVPESWYPSSQSLVYRSSRVPQDLFTLPLSPTRKPMPTVNTPAIEVHAQVSPDGRWLAYQAAENQGARPEVFVRPLSGGPVKYQVSASGGGYPRWRGDGRELFFLESLAGGLGAAGGRLMAVDIGSSQTTFERGTPHPLFDSLYVPFQHTPGVSYHAYAVSRDGERFLLPRVVQPGMTEESPGDAPIVIVLNWASTLQRK